MSTRPQFKYSRGQVNRAGDILIDDSLDLFKRTEAIEVLSNWRECHAYPINTFQATLRGKLKSIDNDALVAQRLKRSPSIIAKLNRFRGMKLSRMHDIGGLRAVVFSLAKARELELNYQQTKFTHVLKDEYDYILKPKSTGYRSIHLIYKYRNQEVPDYDNLLIELQIRSKLQHAWATAVETLGTFINYALKSSEGPGVWLGFFAAAGSAFATLEDCPPVPGYENQNEREIFTTVVKEFHRLNVHDVLQGFSIALDAIDEDKHKGSSYHLVTLDPIARKVSLKSYSLRRLDEASADYAKAEKRILAGDRLQVVLVSAGPVEALKRAYPNYFLDTRAFLGIINQIEESLV